MTKQCKRCKIVKSLDDYYQSKNGKFGRRSVCKICQNDQLKEWRNSRRESFDPESLDYESIKQCSVCKEGKPAFEFHRNSSAKDGFQPYCKVCQRQQTYDWVKTSKYGLSSEEYDNILKEQDYKCGICLTEIPDESGYMTRFTIDHDHETNKIRGLLCNICNKGLGLFKDDPASLRRAIKWVGGELT